MLRQLASFCVFVGALLASPCWTLASAAQDGSNDPSFNTLDDGAFGDGAGPWGSSYTRVRSLALQPDGRIWAVGDFQTFRGAPHSGVVRLNTDGSLDASFQAGTGTLPGGGVSAIVLQPDGKGVIAGTFTAYDGVVRNRIARVNPDGSLDATFDPGLGASHTVQAVALQPDGKLVIGGDFTSVGGVTRVRIARLNSDGSLDTSFNPGAGATGPPGSVRVLGIALQPDGRIVIVGSFYAFNGVWRYGVARLNANGTLDPSFDPGEGADSTVFAVALQNDGKVLIGGRFGDYNTVAQNYIARLNSDGTLDTTFNPGTSANGWIYGIVLQPNGQVLIDGLFSQYGGVPRNRIARLNTNGSLDMGFDAAPGPDEWIHSVAVQPDGKVLVGGGFLTFSGVVRRGLARLDANGAHDESFSPGRGADNTVQAMAVRSDGGSLIGGDFRSFNAVPRNRIARLDPSGALDPTFDPGAGPSNTVSVIALQSNGKALLGGTFLEYAGTARRGVARIRTDGSLDPSFDPGAGVAGYVMAFAIQPDGKVIVAGAINSYDNVPRFDIARANPNGSLDLSFDPGSGSDGWIRAVALQPDGKLIVAGDFSTFNAIGRNRIARLNADGSLDATFVVGPGPNAAVNDVALEPSGRILIGGSFTLYGSTPRGGLARLLDDGSLDASYAQGAGAQGGAIERVALQQDGRAVVAGRFTTYDGVARTHIARLDASGALDMSFDPGLGTNGWILAMATRLGGGLQIAGDFTQYDGVTRHRVARVRASWPAASAYCTAGVSTSGCTPSIQFSGTPSVSASSGFTIDVVGLEAQRRGLVFYGLSGRNAEVWSSGSTSFLCVKSPLQRIGSANSGGVPGQCNGALSFDWLAYVRAHPAALGAPLAAGVTIDAQAWYRDPLAPKTTNLSDALEFVTVP